MGARFRCFGYAGFSVSSIVAATLIGAAAPAEAVVDVWKYEVRNSSPTSPYGLYTNDVYYAPQCADPSVRSCIPREHFFTFQGTTLTLDFINGTALLKGKAVANKPGNTMSWDLQLKFSGGAPCDVTTDLLYWPSKWGKLTTATVTGNPNASDPLGKQGWQCYHVVEGEDQIVSAIGAGGDPVSVLQLVDQLQIGVGANGVLREATGGFVRFLTDAGSSKTWELGMELSQPSKAAQFQIVSCPTSGTDNGDPSIPGTGGRQDCMIEWYGEGNDTFVTSIFGEPGLRGTLTIDGLLDIPDPRTHCGGTGEFTAVLMPYDDPDVSYKGLTIALPNGAVNVPWFLCGIPGKDGKPLIRLINADSDFSSGENFLGILDSVVDQEAQDPADLADTDKYYNSAYACDNDNQEKWKFQPVVAWLPRVGDEIPILDALGVQVRQIRDVTNSCGSARGGTPDLSYLLSNLVYADEVQPHDFHEIIRAEIETIETTLVQSTACISKDTPQSTLSILFPDLFGVNGQSRLLDHIAGNFDAGNYRNVVSKFEWLLAELRDGGSLNDSFRFCYANTDGEVRYFDPQMETVDPGFVRRNFRGDLEAQVMHVIWNINEKHPEPL